MLMVSILTGTSNGCVLFHPKAGFSAGSGALYSTLTNGVNGKTGHSLSGEDLHINLFCVKKTVAPNSA